MTKDELDFDAWHKAAPKVEEILPWDLPPQNGRGINAERRSRLELYSRPYDYPELLQAWVNGDAEKALAAELMLQDIAVTHARLAQRPWRKTLIQGEIDFADLRLGSFVLKLPSIDEYAEHFRRLGIPLSEVTSRSIRDINYGLVEQALYERYRLSPRKGRNFIGNALNGIIHEDRIGYAYIVPKNTHEEFDHKGYVELVIKALHERK